MERGAAAPWTAAACRRLEGGAKAPQSKALRVTSPSSASVVLTGLFPPSRDAEAPVARQHHDDRFRRHDDNGNPRTIQELLGHADVKRTMIDTHVLQRAGGERRTEPARRYARESRMTPRRPVDTLRPPQPFPRLIRCEPHSSSRPSTRPRALAPPRAVPRCDTLPSR